MTANFSSRITVTFSISDLANYDPDMYEEDRAMEDEEEMDDASLDTPKQRSVSQSGEENMEEDMSPGDMEEAPPCRLSIIVEKPGKMPGALNIEASAQDGTIQVNNLSYYADASLARADTPDLVHASADLYAGPSFGSLDEDLQMLMERYLEERGITQALAVFAPDYMDYKEQKEYVRWLGNVKAFVDA
jgi:complement component 1 Q subcomponent-binding protein, mitochondrial